MQTKKQKAYKRRLLNERTTLSEKINRLSENVKVELKFDPDEGDPELAEREKNLSLRATFKERLHEINLALDKISTGGKYGFCRNCNKAIPPERLAIIPEAQYCVPCKTKLERRSRRR